MVTFPPCKINLGLRILSKRPDGYHDIETCFYPVPWTDVLEILPADSFVFTSTGLALPGTVEENLCVKAYRLVQKDFSLPPIHMHLHKIIPSGAGLGGGSSDAAHTLLLLNDIFTLRITVQQLQDYASMLGSDCAFFIAKHPMMGSGKGDLLSPAEVTLKDKYVVVIKPPVHVSTAEAYSRVKPAQQKTALAEILKQDISTWKDLLVNDFEESVFNIHPQIGEIKQELYKQGALYACMSGSGSSVFGIFSNEVDLKNQFPCTTYWSGKATA
ncbi:MAG: 4-(cytidine 5'-diphospho)-2-C-methyl-D-erythritol kinase [Cyclobacteriaceae bacterium]|nr:4-(cytidine 5'-diphospho)-2-C-methyl-D-erythritol kinase [Cyclobacteriaceae bacterium]